MLRSFLAVLAGMIAWPALFLGGNQALLALFPDRYRADSTTDDPVILLVTLALSVAASLLAGYVTAAAAGRRPFAHTLVLGLIQLAIGIFVQLQYWEAIPLWYHLIFLALLVPGHIAGGKLRR